MPVNGIPIFSFNFGMYPSYSAFYQAVNRSINAHKRMEKTMNHLAWRSMRRSRDSIRRRTVKPGKHPKPSAPGTPPHTLKYVARPNTASWPMRTITYGRFGMFTWRVGVAPFSPMAKTPQSRKIPHLHEAGGVQYFNKWKYHGRPYGHRLPRTRKAKDAYLAKMKILFATEDPTLAKRLLIWRVPRTAHYAKRAYLVPGANKAISEMRSKGNLPFIVGVYFR